MGTLYDFKCSACGYRAEVSGGKDAGIACTTVTILCETCRKIYDVADRVMEQDSFKSIPIACPRSGLAKHLIKKWPSSHPCPRCGQKMIKGREVAFWD